MQIAAAALWLKAKRACPEAKPAQLNLVASNLRLSSLPDDDPALVELRRTVMEETGIPAELTNSIVQALSGADHLGSLLKVDAAVDQAIREHEASMRTAGAARQRDLFGDSSAPPRRSLGADGDRRPEAGAAAEFQQAANRQLRSGGRRAQSRDAIKASVLERLEDFLSQHTNGDDLGLRLRGEQLAAGVRFMRLVREAAYDLVVANPPYQGTAKMASAKYVETHYALGKADLFAAFLLRGLELVREHGVSSMLTMRNWMFIKQYSGLREHLLKSFGLRAIGDFDRGAFEDIVDEVVSVAIATFARCPRGGHSIGLCPTPREDRSRDNQRTIRKRAATLCHIGRHEFDPEALKVVPEWPLVYWWDADVISAYKGLPLVGQISPAYKGICTGDDTRLIRRPWEPHYGHGDWQPMLKGGKGRNWIEPISDLLSWINEGMIYGVMEDDDRGTRFQGKQFYFRCGVAFSMIGANFSARVHRRASVFGNKGSSVFPDDLAATVCVMNSTRARQILESLNPGIGFEVGDVNRLPLFSVASAHEIFNAVESAFTVHESHREASVEFKQPGPSPWRAAQEWAQIAVDRPEGAPLPEYTEVLDPEPPTDHLSFALGVALGRFGAHGEGILDWDAPVSRQALAAGDTPPGTTTPNTLTTTTAIPAASALPLTAALPAGILFLDGTLAANEFTDGLAHPAAQPLRQAWTTYGSRIAPKSQLRDYLREKFFTDVHRQMYENRPIHWPLSSEKKTFVAWINIHRWNASTLRVLLADHLQPRLTQLEGELADLRQARDGADRTASKSAKDRVDDVQKWVKELQEFIRNVETCSDKGPPTTDPKCTAREVDARYVPDLDDGVMINSAALWPLLTPQWKDPKKWWTELANAKGKKDYDWSHLALRYWPTRVDQKCQTDPSLGVAHGCFWKYHPARAWKWELRLQQEIAPDFRIEEPSFAPLGQKVAAGRMSGNAPEATPGDITPQHRAAYLSTNAEEALETIEAEALRRRRKLKDLQPGLTILEPGLWTDLPDLCWAMELRMISKQGGEFRLLAPDEPTARRAYEHLHPDHVAARKRLIDTAARDTLFPADEEEDDQTDAPDPADSDDAEES